MGGTKRGLRQRWERGGERDRQPGGGPARGGSGDAGPSAEDVGLGLDYWPRDFGMRGWMGGRMAGGISIGRKDREEIFLIGRLFRMKMCVTSYRSFARNQLIRRD